MVLKSGCPIRLVIAGSSLDDLDSIDYFYTVYYGQTHPWCSLHGPGPKSVIYITFM